METNKAKLLLCIGKIYDETKECELKNSIFRTLEDEIDVVSTYLGVTNTQGFLMALILAMNCEGDTVDVTDLKEHFKTNPLNVLVYMDDIEDLCKTGLLEKEKSPRHRMRQATVSRYQYTVREEVANAILTNSPMPELVIKEDESSEFSVLEEIYKIGQEREEEEISSGQMLNQLSTILRENVKFPLIKRVTTLAYRLEEKYILLYLIWIIIEGHESVSISRTLEAIFDSATIRYRYMQGLQNGTNPLLKDKWIVIDKADFANNSRMSLSEKTLEMLEEYNIKLFNHNKKDNVITPEDIKAKQLVFGEKEAKQLDMLYQVLEDKHFKRTQERLDAKGLPKGITVLLHGLPGTGKTESALQIAKKTNREIMKIEISQSKSMWFGESEKIIKRIFTDYRAYAKKCERTPILFFNEADAIISKRQEGGKSNVAQTENAIQNILLEEFENFEGILIATTNLISNLDSAFDRRFLFKVNYQLPTADVKAQIWQSKLEKLSLEQCHKLASTFDFSGGQIDNIMRKVEIEEIIHGTSLSYDNIFSFCEAETMRKDRVVVGFGR